MQKTNYFTNPKKTAAAAAAMLHLSYYLYNVLSPAARIYQNKKKLSCQILNRKNNISCDV